MSRRQAALSDRKQTTSHRDARTHARTHARMHALTDVHPCIYLTNAILPALDGGFDLRLVLQIGDLAHSESMLAD
jgi:hypothetical protein